MSRRLTTQLVLPLVLLVLGAVIVWHINTRFAADGATFSGPLDDSGLFPRIVGFGLVFLSAATLVQQFLRPPTEVKNQAPGVNLVLSGNQLRAIAVLLTLIVYVSVLRTLGFAVSTPLMLFTTCMILKCRVFWAIVMAVCGPLSMSLIFERLLNVQLPIGTIL